MGGEFGDAAIKMAGSLLLVLGIIVCLLYVLKKLRLGPMSGVNAPKIRLISTLSLAPKRAVALVEVCNQWLVLGIGTESVSLLLNMDRPAEEVNSEHQPSSPEKTFHSLLQRKGLWHQRRRDEAGATHEHS